jgi:hypothetical protein
VVAIYKGGLGGIYRYREELASKEPGRGFASGRGEGYRFGGELGRLDE